MFNLTICQIIFFIVYPQESFISSKPRWFPVPLIFWQLYLMQITHNFRKEFWTIFAEISSGFHEPLHLFRHFIQTFSRLNHDHEYLKGRVVHVFLIAMNKLPLTPITINEGLGHNNNSTITFSDCIFDVFFNIEPT